jgi:hypothetical protein
MRRVRLVASTLATLGVLAWWGLPGPATAKSLCSLQSATSPLAFCDTFDAPAGTGNRSGDLNGQVWGVSRILGDTNFGQGTANAAPPTSLLGCSGTSTVVPPHDVVVCNGQLREATNDNASGTFEAGTVTVLAMYPKQPFDFAGRTGTIGFDISNDTHGTHAAWPELADRQTGAGAVQPLRFVDRPSTAWVRQPLRGAGRSGAIWLLSKRRQHHALDRRFCSRGPELRV